MIARLIAEIFLFLKEVLTHRVESNIKQVFGQTTQVSQYISFGVIQLKSNCLSQQHNMNPLDTDYYSGLTPSYTIRGAHSSAANLSGLTGVPCANTDGNPVEQDSNKKEKLDTSNASRQNGIVVLA